MTISTSGPGASSMSLDDDATIMVSASADTARKKLVAGWVQPGTTVGRYLVVEEIGAGAMGRVVRAYDPKLQREVALKLVETGGRGEMSARLLREAQAMAQLAHPNVVAVHDVETVAEEEDKPASVIYIAMEFVRGRTLGEWIKGKKRSWHEIVEAFVAAARGLAAAHGAGLVHRDFKPANVLVGTDKRIRVTDFGLVRGGHAPPSQDSLDLENSAVFKKGEETLTRLSTVVGTPAYMPPEQHIGGSIGPGSDQYAFCVSLFEGLCGGRRPFRGKTLKELFSSKMEDKIEWPRGSPVPRFVQRAIERGLSARVEDRWPSMIALIDALDNDPAIRRRRWLVGGAVATSMLAFAGWQYVKQGRQQAECSEAGDSVHEVWDRARRGQLDEAFSSAGVGFADRALAETVGRLDAYATLWADARGRHCLSELQAPSEHHDAALTCFDERRARLAALVAVLAEADAEGIRRSVGLAAELPDPQLCADPARVERLPRPPDDPEAHDRVAQTRDLLLRARFVRSTSRRDEALEMCRRAYAEAEALDYPPLLAEASLGLGRALVDAGQLQDGLERVRGAYWLAGEHRYEQLALDAAITLVSLEGRNNERPEMARHWSRHAQMTMARLGREDPLREAALLHSRSNTERVAGEFKRSLDYAERALEIYTDVYGPEHPSVASVHNAEGNAHIKLGRFEEARESFERAISIAEQVYGADHPAVAEMFNSIGIVQAGEGDFESALASFRRAEQGLLRAWGPDHPSLVEQRTNIAVAYAELGDDRAALEHFERSLEQALKAGPNHPSVADAQGNLGVIYKRLGRSDEAVESLRSAVGILEVAFGPGNVRAARSRGNLAGAVADQGDLDEGLELSLDSLGDLEKTLPSDHPEIINGLARTSSIYASQERWDEAVRYRVRELDARRLRPEQTREKLIPSLVALAEAARQTGEEELAADSLTEALETYDGFPDETEVRGQQGYRLAKLIEDEEAKRAVTMARESLAFFRGEAQEEKQGAAEVVDEIEAWLANR